jgi:hypothetical protein
VFAQEASPAAEPIIVPAPNQCTVEPREAAAVAEIVATPAAEAASPAATAEGEPADRTVRAAVLDTVRQALACTNAGNHLALYALYTDAYLAANPPTADELAALEADPVPLTGDLAALLAIGDVLALADGSVSVTVDVIDPTADTPGPARIHYTMVEQDGRYLIDDAVSEPIDASHVGTPAA